MLALFQKFPHKAHMCIPVDRFLPVSFWVLLEKLLIGCETDAQKIGMCVGIILLQSSDLKSYQIG